MLRGALGSAVPRSGDPRNGRCPTRSSRNHSRAGPVSAYRCEVQPTLTLVFGEGTGGRQRLERSPGQKCRRQGAVAV